MKTNKVYAKGKGEEKTLLRHVMETVRFAHSLKDYLPSLPSLVDVENFFDLLIIAAYVHDWGKATQGFQQQLLKNKPYKYRHEVLSAAFVEGFKVPEAELHLITKGVISHHKSFDDDMLYKLHGADKEETDIMSSLLGLDDDFYDDAENRFKDRWNELLWDEIKKLSGFIKKLSEIGYLLNEYDYEIPENPDDPIRKYVSNSKKLDFNLREICFRGSLILSDHMASSGLRSIKTLDRKNFSILNGFTPNLIQRETSTQDKNVLLIAPTGEGKTQASLLWFENLFKKKKATHLYYLLPYTASLNAMYKRFQTMFNDEKSNVQSKIVGLAHSRAFYSLIKYYQDRDENKIENYKAYKDAVRRSKRLLNPVLLSTPWQLLRYFFSPKFFECGFTMMVDSALIIDEIHSYDAKSMGMLIGMLTVLNKHFKVPIMVMSATIPNILISKIKSAFPSSESPVKINIPDSKLEKMQWHRVNVINDPIEDLYSKIEKDISHGKRVLVVSNSVDKAIEIYQSLENIKDRVLLHSKFALKDRIEKEQKLNTAQLLIGTQAIEVSLDIDFDVLYTMPAPLDALIQRFGRVNRNRKRSPANVYVSTQYDEATEYIYSVRLIKRTIDVLRTVDILDQSMVEELMNSVYMDFPDDYLENFNETYQSFLNMVELIKPYSSDPVTEKKFYKLFDSVNVIPNYYSGLFEKYYKNQDFIRISELELPISNRMFFAIKDKEIVDNNGYKICMLEYDPEVGLQKSEMETVL